MTDQIVTIEHIKQKARAAFLRGVRRDDHGMNWNAPALATWLAEWDLCARHAANTRKIIASYGLCADGRAP